jgi:hypothetical protein
VSLEWRKEKRKNLYIGSLRIFLLGQIAIDNNAKCIRSTNYLICKFYLKLEIMKINFQQKHNGSRFETPFFLNKISSISRKFVNVGARNI